MRIPASIKGPYDAAMKILRTHKTLTIILLALFVAAGSGGYLRGDLLGNPAIQFGGQNNKDDDLRACSSMHTIFESFETIAESQQLYVQQMSAIFSEHEKVLRTPSQWKCGAGQSGEPALPALQLLATHLPGWSVFPATGAPPVARPVTFDAFSAVAAELQREYECKLVELQDRAIAEIARNKDQAPGTFCCTEEGCMESGNGAVCTGPETDNSMCNDQCPIYFTQPALAARIPLYDEAINNERTRSRTAIGRALYALRSADMHYEVARQLVCYERASLDLRNELGLTADAVSCMPKIWDAVTSIHDKKKP